MFFLTSGYLSRPMARQLKEVCFENGTLGSTRLTDRHAVLTAGDASIFSYSIALEA